MENKTKIRVLLVEDEEHIAKNLKLNLDLEGYVTDWISNGQDAIKEFNEKKYDIVILDIMLPGMDGLTVCENIRLTDGGKTPIMFLSAKSMAEDRVKGLKKGGDDYLVKPFNLEEFLLRVQILLKRFSQEKNIEHFTTYQFGENHINFESYEANTINGKIVLTKKEILLLKLLIENKNEVVSRERIFQTVWGYSVYPSTRTIDNFILNFRKYFEKDPKKPVYFQSIRGVGYKFTEE